MARPKGGYRLADGTKVPGVTTISGLCKDSGALIHWAWQLGMDGIDYRDARDAAANAGTVAHRAIELWTQGQDELAVRDWLARQQIPQSVRSSAERAFNAFLEWASMTKLEVVETETVMVSEQHQVGGTLDAIAYCNGKLALLDYKSGRVYPEHIIQTAAYHRIWKEVRPQDPIASVHCLRVDKESGAFSHHHWPPHVIETAWRAFLALRDVYDDLKALKRVAS